MLDVHRLRVFRSVVASGSIQAAATNLGYTPSAISQQVTTLQRETGLTLFARVGRGIEVTPAGRALAERVDVILAQLGDIEGLVDDLRAGRSGVLSLSYFASVGSAWMPQLIADLEAEFPDVRLDLHLREHFDPGDALVDVQVVVERPDFVAPSGFVAQCLLNDPYVAALPPGHHLTGVDAVELADLREERWIDNDVARGWCRQIIVEACHSAGFAPPFRLQAHDYRTALAFVAGGLGITCLPRLGTLDLPAGVHTVPVIAPTPVRSIYAVASTATCDTPASRRAVQLLQAAASRAVLRAA